MIQKYNKQLEYAYIDKLNNKISEELFEKTKNYLNKKISEENTQIQVLNLERKKDYDKPDFKYKIDEFMKFNNIKSTFLIKIIDKIEIDSKGNLDIFLKCHKNS